MKVKQLSVFLENRSGRLKEVLEVLEKNNINIRALTIAESSQFGILRLIVNDPQKGLEALKNDGFTAILNDVIAVEVEDKPGGLLKILEVIAKEGMNVEYMYAFVEKKGENAIVIFRFEELDKAIDVLKKAGVSILKNEEVLKL